MLNVARQDYHPEGASVTMLIAEQPVDPTLAPTSLDDPGMVLNGVPIYCRGACCTPPDLVGLESDEAEYRRILERARSAGMNMLRVGGTMLYEADIFYRLCDELGILVWQDFRLNIWQIKSSFLKPKSEKTWPCDPMPMIVKCRTKTFLQLLLTCRK